MRGMGEKMAKLAKQAAKLLAILLTRGPTSWMSSRLAALVPTPERDMKGADHREYALETY